MRLVLFLILAWGAAGAALARLPVEDFFRKFEFEEMKLSPDGRHLAVLMPFERRMNLHVIDLETRSARRLTAMRHRDIIAFHWANDERLLFQMDDDGNESWGLYAVNRDGSGARTLVPPLAGRGWVTVLRYTLLLDRLAAAPDEVLVISNERLMDYPDVFRMNIHNGGRRLVARNPGAINHWVPDGQGRVRAGVGVDKDGRETVWYRRDHAAQWEVLATSEVGEENFRPLGFDPSGEQLYVAARPDGDRASVHAFDPEKRVLGPALHAHPEVDVDQLWQTDYGRRLAGISYYYERSGVHWLDEDFERVQAAIDDALPETVNRIRSVSLDESRMVIFAGSDRHPGKYYLFDRDAWRLEFLGDLAPWIRSESMAERRPIRYLARDGTSIHGYLTLPPGRVEGERVPLVAHPHGGPWVRDYWGFDRTVQFLANRGYAVLQMNFRGSSGYGKAFLMAGRKQFGRAMQEDITDGVQWAVEQGVADPERVAIYGASYGGYAAMAGLVFTPELYKAGINFVGVVDLIEQIRHYQRREWTSAFAYWRRMVGDPEVDAADLRAASPIHFVDRIRAPVLVVHGTRDPRVNLSQAEALLARLKRAGKPHEVLIKRDEGHGFRKEENLIELYTLIERFLAEHL